MCFNAHTAPGAIAACKWGSTASKVGADLEEGTRPTERTGSRDEEKPT